MASLRDKLRRKFVFDSETQTILVIDGESIMTPNLGEQEYNVTLTNQESNQISSILKAVNLSPNLHLGIAELLNAIVVGEIRLIRNTKTSLIVDLIQERLNSAFNEFLGEVSFSIATAKTSLRITVEQFIFVIRWGHWVTDLNLHEFDLFIFDEYGDEIPHLGDESINRVIAYIISWLITQRLDQRIEQLSGKLKEVTDSLQK